MWMHAYAYCYMYNLISRCLHTRGVANTPYLYNSIHSLAGGSPDFCAREPVPNNSHVLDVNRSQRTLPQTGEKPNASTLPFLGEHTGSSPGEEGVKICAGHMQYDIHMYKCWTVQRGVAFCEDEYDMPGMALQQHTHALLAHFTATFYQIANAA